MNALDPMIRRLIEEALLLGNDAFSDLNFNSTRFDYIWRVAFHQLMQGAWSANNIYTCGLPTVGQPCSAALADPPSPARMPSFLPLPPAHLHPHA